MKIPWPSIAKLGIVRDVKDYLLPLNAWTEGRGIRFQDEGIVRSKGYQEVMQGCPVAPYWLLHAFDLARESHWLVAGLGKVYDYSAGGYTEITKLATTYGAEEDTIWNGGLLGNIPVINNGRDKPQMWAPIASATRLVDLSNWPATHLATVVKPFKEFLFALDITEGGTRFPHRVRISHPAAPGSVPSSWDDTDPTKSVYAKDLSEYAGGFVLDCQGLGPYCIVYKEHSTHYFQFIGGANKWKNDVIFDKIGILDTHCVVPFAQNAQHFVMTGDDVIYHNAQAPTSILTKRGRRWLQANLSASTYKRSFCVHNEAEGECWFCFPTEGSSWPTLALIWNYRENTVTYRELDNVSFISGGSVQQSVGDTWDTDVDSWDADLTPWDTFTHPPFITRLVGAKPTASKHFHFDMTEQADGSNFRAYVERTGLDAIGVTRDGEIIRNREAMRFLRRIYIQAQGAPFDVWIATQQENDGAVTWQNEGTFTPGSDQFVDIGRSTKLWGMRFESQANASWTIEGLEPDIEPLGEY